MRSAEQEIANLKQVQILSPNNDNTPSAWASVPNRYQIGQFAFKYGNFYGPIEPIRFLSWSSSISEHVATGFWINLYSDSHITYNYMTDDSNPFLGAVIGDLAASGIASVIARIGAWLLL